MTHPSKVPKKPVKVSGADHTAEARRTNVLLEKLSADFRTFGEGLKLVRDKLDGTFDQVGRNTE